MPLLITPTALFAFKLPPKRYKLLRVTSAPRQQKNDVKNLLTSSLRANFGVRFYRPWKSINERRRFQEKDTNICASNPQNLYYIVALGTIDGILKKCNDSVFNQCI